MLDKSYLSLCRRMNGISSHFDDVRLFNAVTTDQKLRRWRELEGILSSTWQAWCGFLRAVLLSSCRGTVTRSGLEVAPLAPAHSFERIAYIAKCLGRGDNIRDNGELLPHQEPTWGDRQLVLECARFLNLSNLESLEVGLLLETRADRDLRRLRNATAHLSMSGMAEIKELGAYYSGRNLRHPTDFMSWIDNQSGEIAFSVWIVDLLECAELMTD